ncbi:MAG: putative sulfate exporter family transporter, partial [Mobilicoccus sp.]|nr:putative sulfate exporter family transporter [Mobilicoccus sp.]
LGDVIALGWGVVGVVIAAVVLGFLASELIGRALGVPTGLRLLIGAGFSICGAAAVAAAEQVVPERKDEDVVTSLALVVVCGTLMIPLLPLLIGVSGVGQQAAGVWIGASTHEVAQVVAAGGIVGSGALAAAVVVKLARVLLLAPVMIALSWRMRRSREGTLPPLVPVFVAGFIAAVALRSTGVLPPAVIDGAEVAQTVLLSSAMFALGCGVRLLTLRQVGGAPVLLAVLVTAVLIGVGLGGALLLG